jgi:hypothetical protein
MSVLYSIWKQTGVFENKQDTAYNVPMYGNHGIVSN